MDRRERSTVSQEACWGGRTNEAKTVVIHIRTKKTLSTAQTTNDKNLHLSVITPNINGFGSSSKDID